MKSKLVEKNNLLASVTEQYESAVTELNEAAKHVHHLGSEIHNANKRVEKLKEGNKTYEVIDSSRRNKQLCRDYRRLLLTSGCSGINAGSSTVSL